MTINVNGKEYMLIATDGMVEFVLKTPDGTAIKHSMSENIAAMMIGTNATVSEECEGFNVEVEADINRFFFPAIEVVKTEKPQKEKKSE